MIKRKLYKLTEDSAKGNLSYSKFSIRKRRFEFSIDCVVEENKGFRMFTTNPIYKLSGARTNQIERFNRPMLIKKDELKGVKFTLDLRFCDIVKTK
jgi:hypothetical protein